MQSISIKKPNYQLNENSAGWAIFTIRALCAFLFLFSAYDKLASHAVFYKGLHKVEAISAIAIYISWLVPIAEAVVAVLIAIPKTVKIGLYGFIALLLTFTGYISAMVLWAKHLPCHCNVLLEQLSFKQHIWFNLVFIALAVVALRLNKTIHPNK